MSSTPWSGRERVLLHGGTIYSPASPFATAMLVEGGTVAWLGEDSAAAAHRDSADRVVDLRGALVTPGFVDAHVHTTSTGLALDGLDLSDTHSLAEALELLTLRSRALRGGTILGHGWDETRWPEQRPPSREELDRASWGSVVYLSRIDVHSAAVSSALIAAVPGLDGLEGYAPSSPLTRAAHHAARETALATLSASQRRDAQRRARAEATRSGIVSLHEMVGPSISGVEDLAGLVALAKDEPGPVVFGFWGELAQEGGLDRARLAGAYALGGDLSVDGAIGSRTALLADPYTDAPDTHGARYLDPEQIAEHVVLGTQAGYPTAFHCIGDAACRLAVEGFQSAAERVGVESLRSAGHRLEHAELLADDGIETMARLGIIASMQPMFDDAWAGPGAMYEQRIGTDRAATMNRFADVLGRGVALAFGSDAPVTPLGPWAAVRAAMWHSVPAQRLSARAAFAAHTRGGWRAAGRPDVGVLAPGAPAHYAVWDVHEVVVQAPDDRLSAWSTDPRSGTPGLPALLPDHPLPKCVRTVVAGRTVHDEVED